ncbi:undecaprenyl-diphosphatase [Cypionkella sp.]|uniref:undecaprenyl-diphosphatase n=1 Tax=Cypionkella sp. TaxID=2811411 RepID=UPI002726FD3B|nr:undecaprenyl-diphosphatase [Cypionkella sp.]MDO8984410.1 undecaprenyl-diphosphatase [Cypionkella sp.]MDP1577349.1 undecaprenyl-diphosphatase [Cypionkella sp.]MDP2048111.1 undecaprenyl-diphosphatase [Cypionkella sp.]
MSVSAVELWNQSAFLAINAGVQAPAFVITIAKILANWTINLAMILMIHAWVRRGRAVRFALLDATCAALIGLGIAQGISAIWYHPRPFEIGLGRQLLDHAAEASFPSDHATLMFSLAIPLLFCAESRRWGGALLLLGFAVAWSRIYLGVHFPLDMLGAFVVAAFASFLIRMADPLLHRLFYPRLVSIYETALRRLGLPGAIFPRNL